MKRLIPFVLAAAIALPVSGTFAAEQSTPDRDKKATAAKPGSGMNMMDDKQTAQMQEHMQTTPENMKAMHGTGGPMMMGGGQHGGMMMGANKDMAGGDMMKRDEMMEKRKDMMQMKK